MADSTINGLEQIDAAATADQFVVWDTSEGDTKKMTVAQLKTLILSTLNASSVGGSGKYISAIIEANGVITATATNLTTNIIADTARWLRFSADSKTSLVIKANTMIAVGSYLFVTTADTTYSMGSSLTAGADYFVYLTYSSGSWSVSCSTTRSSDTSTSRCIGRFHTLCADVGSSVTMIAPSSTSAAVGDSYLVKPYNENEDADFYAFYNKSVTAVEDGGLYDVVTMEHPLSGYSAGDILPESVWCLTWKPNTRYEDAMVYDKATDRAIDVYLQSGSGVNTKSVYGATHTVSKNQTIHKGDMLAVGKELLSDHEFTSAALGSNECTNITGSSDKTTVGGHVDTASRRMISAIGCEEMCGYLWQWLRDVAPLGSGSAYGITTENGASPTQTWYNSGSTSTSTGWQSVDGQSAFGKMYLIVAGLLAGGFWVNRSNCGSRSRNADNAVSFVGSYCGARGSSRVIRCA